MAAMVIQFYTRITRWLIFNTTPDNYEAVASSWLSALLVIAASFTIGIILSEWVLKRMDGRRRQWGRNRLLLLMLLGAFITGVGVVLIYGLSPDFQTVVMLPGLFVGILVSWVLSGIIFLLGHFVIPDFRRDLYGF